LAYEYPKALLAAYANDRQGYYLPILPIGSVYWKTCVLKKFISPKTRIVNTAAVNTGTSTTVIKSCRIPFTAFKVPIVAPFVPSMASKFRSMSFLEKELSAEIPKIREPMATNERTVGMQHAAARTVAVPKVSFSGAGMM
jgi:hypothetical protein